MHWNHKKTVLSWWHESDVPLLNRLECNCSPPFLLSFVFLPIAIRTVHLCFCFSAHLCSGLLLCLRQLVFDIIYRLYFASFTFSPLQTTSLHFRFWIYCTYVGIMIPKYTVWHPVMACVLSCTAAHARFLPAICVLARHGQPCVYLCSSPFGHILHLHWASWAVRTMIVYLLRPPSHDVDAVLLWYARVQHSLFLRCIFVCYDFSV